MQVCNERPEVAYTP